MFRVLFLTFELLFFNGNRNMNYGRKFHFVGIYLFKFILHLKFHFLPTDKKLKIFQGFLTFKLKVMIFEVYDT